MNDLEGEPLSPELSRLLAVEKSRLDPPAGMQARVLEKLGASFLDGAPLAIAAGAQPAPMVGGDSVAAAPLPATAWWLHHLPLAVGIFGLGGLTGGALHAMVQKHASVPTQPSLSSTRSPAVSAPPPFPVAEIAAIAPVAGGEPDQAPLPTRAPRPASAPAVRGTRQVREVAQPTLALDRELAAERALIEQARTALSRGKTGDALAALLAHERAFGQGTLVEEREALRIVALAGAGQGEAAREKAAAFRRAFPHSLLLRTIDAATSSAP